MARTAQQQLDAVDAAIRVIEEGSQSYATVLGQQYTRANIAELYKQRDLLKGEVSLANLGGDGPVGILELGLGRI